MLPDGVSGSFKISQWHEEISQHRIEGYVTVTQNPVCPSYRIGNDDLALITLEEPLFGMVLTDPFMAQTFHIIFETLWQSGENPGTTI